MNRETEFKGADSLALGRNCLEAARQHAANLDPGRLPESVIGKDDRSQVVMTGDIPWRWICQLLIAYPDGTAARATGWFSGQHTVMTAGHVVFSGANGGWAR